MNIGDLEPIQGGEKELYSGRIRRLVFEHEKSPILPNCPICKNNKKVFAAAGKFVCQNDHDDKP
jgi:hypothetical protein